MYLSHYELEEDPFQKSPNPRFLWMGEQYKEVMAAFEYWKIDNRGLVLLTGDPGTGKTLLINALINRQSQNTMAVSITNPVMEKLDFYNLIAHTFNLNKTFQSKGDFFVHFSHFLHKTYSKDEKIILIIDEADRLTREVLEEVSNLSNLETEYSPVLLIILVGKSKLNNLLSQEKNKGLRQQIRLSYHLSPLNKKETLGYIEHRLKISGGKHTIFKPDALAEIHAFSNGYPRLINIICDYALLFGHIKVVKKIDGTVIRGAIIKNCSKDFSFSGGQKENLKESPRILLKDEEKSIKPLKLEFCRENFVKLTFYFLLVFLLAVIFYCVSENLQVISNVINKSIHFIAEISLRDLPPLYIP